MMKKWCVLAGLLGAAAGCGRDDRVASTVGTVELATVTTGEAIDEDGFSILVNGVLSGTIDSNGTLDLAMDEGTYVIELTDLADPCVVVGDNPVSVEVAAAGTVAVAFNVSC
jgi:hypothetical protein